MKWWFPKKNYLEIERWKNSSRFWKRLKKQLSFQTNFLKLSTVLVLLLLMVYETFFILKYADFLTINKIEINQLRNIPYNFVINTLQLNLGDSILKAQKEINLHKKKLFSNPWIKDFSYKIKDQILQISITERNPAYVCVAGNGERFIISEDGKILCREKDFQGKLNNEIIISGIFPSIDTLGKSVDSSKWRKIKEWIDFLKNFPLPLSEINLSDEYNFFFRLKNGIKVYVSSPQELLVKKKLFLKILEKIQKEKLLVEYIDLRTNGGLILKPY